MEAGAEEGHYEEVQALLEGKEKLRVSTFSSVQLDVGRGALYSARLSKWYLMYCVGIAIASLGLMIFLILNDYVYRSPVSIWVAIVDGFLMALILFETAIDIGFLGKLFWKSAWHVFDFVVCVTSIIGWILLMFEVFRIVPTYGEFVTLVLLAARYISQATRVIRYIYVATQAKATQELVEGEPIEFTASPERSEGGTKID